MSEINNYDPNPYDNVTIDEALAQIYDRVNDRTIRQMVTLLKNTAGDTSRYTIEKATAESGEVTYTLMRQISGGTPTPVGDIVSLRGSQILANYDGELQILDNIINIIKVALDGKADTTDIPTVPIMAIQKNGTGITPVDGTVNITVPVAAADVAALPDTTRYAAALSLTIDSATFVITGQLKDQNGDNLGTAQIIDLPLESVVVGGSYNSQTQKVVLTLQNGNTIEFSVADLVYGLQTELSETNKLNPAYINYDNTHRAVSDAEKSEWNGKQDAIDSSHKLSADLVDDTGATNKFATEEELEQIKTNKNNISKQQDTTEQGGNGYAIINGQRLYMGSETQPPIPPQSIWLNNGVKIKSINYFDTDNYVLVPVSSSSERNGTNCGILPPGQYTLSAIVSTSHSQLYRTIKNGDNYTLDTILSLPYTFTADGISEQIIRVAGNDKNSWSEEGYSNIMLNTGDTAETYIDYWT